MPGVTASVKMLIFYKNVSTLIDRWLNIFTITRHISGMDASQSTKSKFKCRNLKIAAPSVYWNVITYMKWILYCHILSGMSRLSARQFDSRRKSDAYMSQTSLSSLGQAMSCPMSSITTGFKENLIKIGRSSFKKIHLECCLQNISNFVLNSLC